MYNRSNPIHVNYNFAANSESEIDLFQLIALLWQKKLLIIVVTLITTLLAAYYAFYVADEKWTAKAYISPPRIEQIQTYIDVRREYARILNESVDVGAIGQQLFADFINFAYSPDVKIDFLQQSEFYKQKSAKFTTAIDKRKYLEELSEKNLVVENPDEKKKLRYYTIAMSADTPQAAKKLLEQFINFLNKKSFIISNYEFNDRITNLMLSLQKEKSNLEEQLKVERKNTIESLSGSYSVAKNAGIKNYYDVVSNLQVFGPADKFMMGEKLLSAELDVLKNSPIIYPFRYYQIIEQLGTIDKIGKIDLTGNQAYRYEMVPDEPLTRDQPKKLLMILMGTILGIMISAIYILGQEAIVNYCNRCRT